jgi:hypothetical protein
MTTTSFEKKGELKSPETAPSTPSETLNRNTDAQNNLQEARSTTDFKPTTSAKPPSKSVPWSSDEWNPPESTHEKVQDFNRGSREHIANSPDIPAPRSDETGPLRNMREYAREQQEKYRKDQEDSTPSSDSLSFREYQRIEEGPGYRDPHSDTLYTRAAPQGLHVGAIPSSAGRQNSPEQRDTQTNKKQPNNSQVNREADKKTSSSASSERAPVRQWETTNSGAPRVRHNTDTESRVVVDREGRKTDGERLSERRAETPVNQPVVYPSDRTNSGAPRIRHNIDTGSTVVVDSEWRKISGSRQSDRSSERTTVPETQSSNTSSWKTQTETPGIPTKPEKPAVNTPMTSQTQEMEFVTRVNTQTGQKTLHWKKPDETAWQGSDGSISSNNFPQHSITRGNRPPTGFENLYAPKKDEKNSNNTTPSQLSEESATPKKPETPAETAQNFEPTGDIDAETARRDQEEIAKYKAEQAKKTPEQKAQERREAKDMFDLGRGDTSGVTEVTGEKAKKYETTVDTPENSNQKTDKKNPQTQPMSNAVEAPTPEIDTKKNLPPLGWNLAQDIPVDETDDGFSQNPVRGEWNTIYQPVNLPPTEQHPEWERGRISYTPPPKNITGAFDPYAGMDRMRQEEQQEGWTRFEWPQEWKEGDTRETQLRQSFGDRWTRLLNNQQATHDTAALSKWDGMVINASPHPDLAKRRAERVAQRRAEWRPTPNTSPDGSALDDDISTFDFGASIGSRHAVVNNSTGEVWRSRQDRREGKPPVAVQVNRWYVNRVDSGGSQNAPNSDQLLELKWPNPYNLPFSTENHRVFVANGTIYAGGTNTDHNGQITTRRIGRYNADNWEVVIDHRDPAFIEWRRKMEKDAEILPDVTLN